MDREKTIEKALLDYAAELDKATHEELFGGELHAIMWHEAETTGKTTIDDATMWKLRQERITLLIQNERELYEALDDEHLIELTGEVEE